MAILNKIRQRSIFLIAIIALALFAFVLSDVLSNRGFSTNKSQRTLAVVNGEDIDQQDFAKQVELTTSQYGGQITSTQAVNMVYEQEIRKVLLKEQMDELGITVEQDRIGIILKDALQEQPQFQDASGVYSEAKVREYVATLKATNEVAYDQWVEYENQLAKNEQELIYFNLVKAGLTATLKDGQLAYEKENNTRDIQFVQVPFTSIEDDKVEVSKSEIENYIKSHENKYKAEASRNLRFVKFEEAASLSDDKAIKSEVARLLKDSIIANGSTGTNDTIIGLTDTQNAQELVNEFSDQPYVDRYYFKGELPTTVADNLFDLEEGAIYGPYKDGGFYKISKVIAIAQLPDSVKSSHILLPYAGLQNAGDITRTKAETKTLADSLATVIRATSSKMAELAPEFSTDALSAAKGGDLGTQPKNRFVKPFDDFVFEKETGTVGVVETQFGYHVIRVDQSKDKKKAIKVATIAKEITPSQKTVNDAFSTTTKFQMAATDKKDKFAEIAKESNYTVRPVNNIKPLDETIPGEGSQRDIIKWAFKEETNTGDIERFQINGGYLVVQLTGKTKKGLMSVEEASATVTPLVRDQKKADLILKKIEGKDMQAVATSEGTTVQSASAISLKNPTIGGVGTEPKVVGAAFGLKEGVVSKPIVGEKGVYLVKATAIKPAAKMDNYASFAMQQTALSRGAVNTSVVKALKDAAEIEDKRVNFY